MTKARELLKIAYATYRRDQPNIAKDIFVLAMEDESAAREFGSVTKASLQQRFEEAVASEDYDGAAEILDAMEECQGEDCGDGFAAAEDDELSDDDLDEMLEDDGDDEDMEGATSPGDFVEPAPAPDLAPAQVASLVTLARRIKADGHADLAGRITRALGL